MNPATVHFPWPDYIPSRPEELREGPFLALILDQARNWAEAWDFERPTNPQDAEPEPDDPSDYDDDASDYDEGSDGDGNGNR
jgi:hypothetical protein